MVLHKPNQVLPYYEQLLLISGCVAFLLRHLCVVYRYLHYDDYCYYFNWGFCYLIKVNVQVVLLFTLRCFPGCSAGAIVASNGPILFTIFPAGFITLFFLVIFTFLSVCVRILPLVVIFLLKFVIILIILTKFILFPHLCFSY